MRGDISQPPVLMVSSDGVGSNGLKFNNIIIDSTSNSSNNLFVNGTATLSFDSLIINQNTKFALGGGDQISTFINHNTIAVFGELSLDGVPSTLDSVSFFSGSKLFILGDSHSIKKINLNGAVLFQSSFQKSLDVDNLILDFDTLSIQAGGSSITLNNTNPIQFGLGSQLQLLDSLTVNGIDITGNTDFDLGGFKLDVDSLEVFPFDTLSISTAGTINNASPISIDTAAQITLNSTGTVLGDIEFVNSTGFSTLFINNVNATVGNINFLKSGSISLFPASILTTDTGL